MPRTRAGAGRTTSSPAPIRTIPPRARRASTRCARSRGRIRTSRSGSVISPDPPGTRPGPRRPSFRPRLPTAAILVDHVPSPEPREDHAVTKRLFDRIRAIDTDTHITEPPDVWTERVSTKKWGDAVPHVRKHEGRDVWFIRDEPAGAPGFVTMAGFDGSLPDGPRGYDDIPASAYDAKHRLAHMDAEGIYAQVLYPNVGGFGSGGFLKLKQPELMLECVRAYNDFLVEWCSADAN